jgi:signal transduction histidine kinase
MQSGNRTQEELRALAGYLEKRRDAILSAWRLSVDLDPELKSAASSTRSQFIDHIPAVLDAFEDRLRARAPEEKAEARFEQKEQASEHGMHRWQQGYNLTETMFEWGHLHLVLLAELERYAAEHPEVEASVMQIARRELVRLGSDGACASAARYAEMQQSEAASRLHDLENALVELRELEMERATTWREAAHDLRGAAHVITNASAVLSMDGVPDSKRTQASDTLQRAAASLAKLLNDLLDHARLEAGHEHLNVRDFDAATLIKEFCATARPLAAGRNLFLKCEGPPSLAVQGDAVKVQRILQNLVLNALKATQSGGVKVTWESDVGAHQWALCVQDTGPGFRREPASPLQRALRDATEGARETEEGATAESESSLRGAPAPTLPSQSPRTHRMPFGEGIGLSIVKRLCELLDASIELQSAPGEGTTFRLIFPSRYSGRA